MEELNIIGAQGENIVADVTVEDDAGTDLTGNVFELVIWKDGYREVVHRQTDAQLTRVTNALRINIPTTTTTNLCVARYPMNLWMTAGGIKSQVAFGYLTITEGLA